LQALSVINTMKLMPVALPPGRATLTTRPSLTGSWLTMKEMGIVVVADPDAHERRRTPYIRVGCSLLPIIGDWLPDLSRHA
jgi:hypothetical protein